MPSLYSKEYRRVYRFPLPKPGRSVEPFHDCIRRQLGKGIEISVKHLVFTRLKVDIKKTRVSLKWPWRCFSLPCARLMVKNVIFSRLNPIVTCQLFLRVVFCSGSRWLYCRANTNTRLLFAQFFSMIYRFSRNFCLWLSKWQRYGHLLVIFQHLVSSSGLPLPFIATDIVSSQFCSSSTRGVHTKWT